MDNQNLYMNVFLVIIIFSILGITILPSIFKLGNFTAKEFVKGTKSTEKIIKNIGQKTAKGAEIVSKTALDTGKDINHMMSHKKTSFIPHVSSSMVTGTHKKGYCLIGEYKNVRSCIYTGQMDFCQSGEIFPTKDICINPKLRV